MGGLRERFHDDYEQFFADYDAFRYRTERHLPACIAGLNVAGKRVLEIGLGEGSDSELLIREGARWSGVDLTTESVDRVQARLTLRGLPFEQLRQGSVLDLPFADNSFDLVFSHGVLHHVPDILRAESEISRVLRPDGELVIMMYARWSLNYLVSIAVLRRAALLAAVPLVRIGVLSSSAPQGILAGHLDNVRATGLFRYLVYDRRRVGRDFPSFRVTRTYKRFMHAPPLPVHRLPGQSLLGWHLWVHLRPTTGATAATGAPAASGAETAGASPAETPAASPAEAPAASPAGAPAASAETPAVAPSRHPA
jgi:SAM-dependent methyltransferase